MNSQNCEFSNRKEELNFFYSDIQDEFDQLKDFQSMVGQGINTARHKRLNSIKDEDIPPGAAKEHLDWAIEYYFENEIWKTFVNSLVILIYASFERNIKNVCERIKKQNQLDKDLNTKNKGLVIGAKKYLKKHGGFKRPEEEIWNAIDDIRVVRNICTHGDFIYDNMNIKSQKAIRNVIKKKCGITLSVIFRLESYS